MLTVVVDGNAGVELNVFGWRNGEVGAGLRTEACRAALPDTDDGTVALFVDDKDGGLGSIKL